MPKILAIDDKQDNLITITAVLKSLIPGCRVITAQSGPEGIEMAKTESPDTILLDIRMPEMDGYEVCERLKNDEATKHIPIIMLTAINRESKDLVKGLSAGADAYLTKPLDESVLVAQINTALRVKAAEDQLRNQKAFLEEMVLARTVELTRTNERLEKEIKDHRRAEKEKMRVEAQLRQSQKMEAIGTLAGGIAHDFNNILAIILGNAELASDDVPDWNPGAKSLKEIRLASLRAKDMVRQLLAFSRKSEEESKPLSLASIIKESMKMLRTAVSTSVRFEQHISEDSCNILGDAAQMNQIMMNVVTNAAHAMSERGGLLEVTLDKIILQEEKSCFDWVLSPGGYVRLKVRDTGAGISPEIMARIFDPYYTTKEVGKGTGMGLSVVHGIVNRHGGGIRVASQLGEGTVFEIYFPALEGMAEEEKTAEEEIQGGAEKILFVDDEASIMHLNHQRLERLGYQVKSTTKPLEALEWFKTDPHQFHIVITDMNMPEMTGDRLLKEILKIRPDMPAIICTGYSEQMSEKKAVTLGARKYMEKPMEMAGLALSVREVLDGTIPKALCVNEKMPI